MVEETSRLLAIIESSPLGVSLYSMTANRRIFSNSNALKMFGAADDTELAEFDPRQSFLDPADALILDEHSTEVLSVPRREVRRKIDGSLWVSMTTRQRLDLDGEDCFLIWYEDVTQREISEERFQRVFNIPTMPIALYRTENKDWIEFNDAFLSLFGYARDELSMMTWVDLTHPEDVQKNVREFEKATQRKGKSSYTLRKRFIHKTGKDIHARIHTEHIRDANGNSQFVILVVDDITEDVAREERLQKFAANEATLRKKADTANEAKSEFLATMSHEIRTPLTALLGVADLLALSELDEEQKELVETLSGAGKHLEVIINDVLDLAKLEAEQMVLASKPFVISELTTSVSSMYLALAGEKNLIFDLDIDPNTKNVVIVGDVIRLRQILMNLLGNAIKFTSQGSVDAKIALSFSSDETSALLSMTVRDTGVGIPTENLDEIFEPFIQIDGSRTKTFQGTGLGLAVSKRLIDKMGGRIQAESSLGNGATFSVSIPVGIKPAEHTSNTPEATVSVRDNDQPKDIRILIAEDDAVNRLIVKRMLAKWGYDVEFVFDGEAAVAAITENEYDLIFLDIHMPLMDGVEVMRHLVEHDIRRPSVYAFTADLMAEKIDEYLEAGFTGCIQKPIDWDTFKKILSENSVG